MADKEKENDLSFLTLSERLTLDFYNWERRGRGWQYWGDVVDLEPLYEPFYYNLASFHFTKDDGQIPTIFSSLIDKVKKSITGSSCEKGNASTPKQRRDEEEPKPDLYEDNFALREITLSLLPDQKIDINHAEQFLLNLSSCALPLCFEIIGTAESSSVQLVCREPDLMQVWQQMKAYFPDVVAYNEGEVLDCVWDNNRQMVVVDFGLSQEFMRPLRIFNKFEPDPLTGIIGALENLDKDEIGIFQILFQPVCNPWSEDIIRSVTDGQGKSFFSDSPEMVRLVEEKISKPLFAAVIRVMAQGQSSNRAWEIARSLSGGLSAISNPQSNELMPLRNDGYDDFFHCQDVFYRQSRRSGMILNSEELVTLVHPPSVSVQAKKLRRELKKTKAAPAIASGGQFVLGENVHQGQKSLVTLSREQRLRHMHIIGATGTGKSTLLLKLIVQDIENGNGIGVLDPHGDLIDKILGYIPENRLDDVVLLDPSDTKYPVGLNILSAYSEQEKIVLSSDLVSVFRRLSTSWGDQMNSILANAILAFLESSEGGTIIDLRRFLVEKDFRTRFLHTVKDREVLYYWQKVFFQLSSKQQAPILTRLDTFLRPKPVRYMVAQKEGINFQDIMDNRKIFLAKLAHGLIGMENAYLLGTIITSKFHQAALARQSTDSSQRQDFYLYIDEFQNFVTESMTEILSGARKYHFGLILAHQEMRQLWSKDSELTSSVISNPGTRICFRLGDFDAKKLEDGFSVFDAQDLQNLGTGEAIARIERNEYDFNLNTFMLPDVDTKIAHKRRETIIELSRKKYACSETQIEEVLAKDKVVETDAVDVSDVLEPSVRIEKEKPKPVLSEKILEAVTKRAELLPQEQGFLRYIQRNSDMFVTKIYKALRLSAYKGDKLKQSLIEKGMVVQQETRKGSKGRLAKVLNLTDKGLSIVKKLGLKGKGGDEHQEIQETIKEQARVFGWRATTEKRISKGSLESVDVELSKDDIRVAVEISSTTEAKHEIENIRKCLDAGYDYILAVSSDEEKLSKLKTEVKKGFSFKERERIRFYTDLKVKNFLSGVHPVSIVSENAIVSGQIKKQKELLDTKEAAAFLGISVATLYEWVIQKRIPYIKVGRLNKFRRKDLEKWLEKKLQKDEGFDILGDD